MPLALQPVTYREACEFVRQHHRHHDPPQGHKFSIAVNDGEQVVGVVMVGRPVARSLDDGMTLEVTRLCTSGAANAASMLYGAAWRAAKALGYRRMFTYTLAQEGGYSLTASGWRHLGPAGGGEWNQPGRHRKPVRQPGLKSLWQAPDLT